MHDKCKNVLVLFERSSHVNTIRDPGDMISWGCVASAIRYWLQ